MTNQKKERKGGLFSIRPSPPAQDLESMTWFVFWINGFLRHMPLDIMALCGKPNQRGSVFMYSSTKSAVWTAVLVNSIQTKRNQFGWNLWMVSFAVLPWWDRWQMRDVNCLNPVTVREWRFTAVILFLIWLPLPKACICPPPILNRHKPDSTCNQRGVLTP